MPTVSTPGRDSCHRAHHRRRRPCKMFWDQQILDQSYIKKPQIGQLTNMLDLNGQILYCDELVARL